MPVPVQQAVRQMVERLIGKQQQRDGSWRFCFESGTLTDAQLIVALRSLQIGDEQLIRQLHHRLQARQQPEGFWKLYSDEDDGNLSATVEAYYAMLYSGLSRKSDVPMQRAKQYILSRGGLRKVNNLLTQVLLACTGQKEWPSFFPLPVGLMLVPAASPVNFYEFSGYGRVHLAPVLLLADRKFSVRREDTPDLSDLEGRGIFWSEVGQLFKHVTGLPGHLHRLAVRKAESYMLDRIESDGTLYSYATATLPMLFALHSLGYDNRHPRIVQAVDGLKSFLCPAGDGTVHVQNTTSTIWDTALISHALQQAGVSAEHPSVQAAGRYLLARQHTRLGDWSSRVKRPRPGGWGFSDINTINPDVDDTTAALRAIRRLGRSDAASRDAFARGLQWVLAMQNDDGGWPAFERNNDNPLLANFPIEGAADAATDPSIADLTGRTLEFLGRDARFTAGHPAVRRAVRWLKEHQKLDGSWYGRWGICYIYGTWAALTGMMAVGEQPQQSAIRRAVSWLHDIQRSDGGWGESCASDRLKRYVPLRYSTLVQTAWAVDALIAVHPAPTPAIDKGVVYLLDNWSHADSDDYPTGAGLPGHYYTRYHSYPHIWPLLTLSHYYSKYGDGE